MTRAGSTCYYGAFLSITKTQAAAAWYIRNDLPGRVVFIRGYRQNARLLHVFLKQRVDTEYSIRHHVVFKTRTNLLSFILHAAPISISTTLEESISLDMLFFVLHSRLGIEIETGSSLSHPKKLQGGTLMPRHTTA